MSEIVLLDTNIIADHFNGVEQAVSLISSFKSMQSALSVVTYTETLVGFDNFQQEENFNKMMQNMLFLSIEKSTARIAADLKKEYRFKLPDAYQAALAVEHQMILLTRNTKDFDPSVHKFVKIPYKLHK